MRANIYNKDRFEGNEGQEFAQNSLIQISVDTVNWQVLHRNPATGEYWKESYPQSELHGGGPPVFVKISEKEAMQKFGINPHNGDPDKQN